MSSAAQAMASSPPDPIRNPSSEAIAAHPLPITREEGELSSSDCDQECPDQSASPSSGTAIPPPSAGPDHSAPTNGLRGANEEVNAMKGSTQVSSVSNHVQASLPQKYGKTSLINQLPPKNVTSRTISQQENSNLVISFSDDESSSDSDGNKKIKSKCKTDKVHGNRKPSTLTTEGPKKYGKMPRNINQEMAEKPSLSHKFVPSMIKNHANKKRGDNTLSGGQGSNSKNNMINKRMEVQDLGSGLGSKRLEVLDLRHQIALRENELKRRSAQVNKPSALSASQNSGALNSIQDSGARLVKNSADVAQPGPKVPPSKRLKVGPSFYAGNGLEQERQAARSLSPPKSLMLGSSNMSKVGHFQKASSVGITDSSIVRWKGQDKERVMMASQDLHVTKQDGTTNGDVARPDLANRMSNLEILPSHNVLADKIAPNTFTKNGGTPLASSFWNSLDDANASKQGNREIQTLVEIEESLDKELADAQELRRMCEIEERTALKAYRKAQRALLEANAKCAHLYQQRDLYSSRLQSCIRDDPGLLGCSNGQGYLGIRTKSSNDMPENMDLMPLPSQQMQTEDSRFNQPVYASNMQFVNGDFPYQHVNGQNLGSELCSDPDGSTSEPLPRRDNNQVPGESYSNEQSISADEDEDILLDSIRSKHGYHRYRGKSVEGDIDIPHRSGRLMSVDNTEESLRLEATLRSELFARFGARARNSKGSDSCMKPVVEQVSQSDCRSGKPDRSEERGLLPEVERIQQTHSDRSGKPDRSEERRLLSEMERNQQTQSDGSGKTDRSEERQLLSEGERIQQRHSDGNNKWDRDLGSTPALDDEDNVSILKELLDVDPTIFPSTFSLTSAFHYVKIMISPRVVSHPQNHEPDVDTGVAGSTDSDESKWMIFLSNSSSKIAADPCETEASSYSSDLAVDPFWSLCMFELRGKCNNDECPWQHVKDYTTGRMTRDMNGDSNGAGPACEVASTSNGQCCSALTNQMKFEAPAYVVSVDILKADSHSYDSFVAQRVGQPWQKCFSISLAISGFFKQMLNADDSVLQNNDGRIEVFGCWTSQPSYFRNRNCGVNDQQQASVGNGQSLETALLLFNQEADKFEAKIKALSVLSRALEGSPTSVVLWMAYLVIYYGKTKPIGKDDMHSLAIKHNQGSYELWLMYVNSRPTANSRLAAYKEALSALHEHSSVSDGGTSHTSSCILDLFLQMINCYCMSGNPDKATHMILNLLPLAEKSNDRFNSLLSSILLSRLTITDKCVFWVCSVYLVIYRKLPDAIVQQFECDKDVLSIEWPPAHRTDEERCKVTELVEYAVSNFGSYISSEPYKHVKVAQNFALSHVRCKVALDGLEKSRDLLGGYAKMYPTCLDLALMKARVENHDFEGLSFHGFENALSKWPKGANGFQCIWHQYAEYALRSGQADFAKELMNRWFTSVWKLGYPEPNMDQIDTSGLDALYGLLNLSLHKLLQKKHEEAREAMTRALKTANHENYALCLREHAVFMLTDESLAKNLTYIDGILNLLNSYLTDSRAFPVKDPLSRKFIEDVKKPRLQQLIRNILCPISTNFLLVNSVLGSLFGPSLLPQEFGKAKDLVDFTEAILEISPANYPLAISLCKRILTDDRDSEASPSASLSFWAGSVLVGTFSHAVPIAPESIWVEAASLLGNISGCASIIEGFYKKALSVYPFSVKLWKSYYHFADSTGGGKSILESAKEKGIELEQSRS